MAPAETEGNKSNALPNAEFIERCQIEYDRNPGSRVFAPLSEAYRKMGLLEEAFEITRRGVKLHPDFAAGRIAYARLFLEKKKFNEALDQLKRASELSPDNLLAFQLLGETYLELRKTKEALAAFKMVLLLNPLHARAQQMVRKWEFITADEFSDEAFEWTPGPGEKLENVEPPVHAQSELTPSKSREDREAHRAISISDALTVRNDLEGAFAVLGQAVRYLGLRPDLEQRLLLLGRRLGLRPDEVQRMARESAAETPKTAPAGPDRSREKKKQKLKRLLKRLDSRTS